MSDAGRTPTHGDTPRRRRGLWECPLCRRTFANPNQTHTCAPLGGFDAHFEGVDPGVRRSFDIIVEALGPLTTLSEKTRIALHVRMSFAAFQPRKHWLNGHLVLARIAEHPLIRRVQVFSPRNVLHEFRVDQPEQIDSGFLDLCREAYEVGEQRHLRPDVGR
jgi:hypothetical protein